MVSGKYVIQRVAQSVVHFLRLSILPLFVNAQIGQISPSSFIHFAQAFLRRNSKNASIFRNRQIAIWERLAISTRNLGEESMDHNFNQSSNQQSTSGQNPYGQQTNGQSSFGQQANGQGSFGQQANGQGSFGQQANGQGSFGQQPYGQPPYGQPPYGQQPYPMYPNRDVSVGDWMLSYLVCMIPLVNLVMLLIWAFDSNTIPSKRNWARASLLWVLIIIGIYVLLIFLLGGIVFMGIAAGSN